MTIEKIKRIYASTAIYKFSQGLKNAETDDFDSAFDNVLDFFGNKITVTGLLCGRDIINQLKGKISGEVLLLSDSMIKPGSDLFLDDYRICDVEKELNVKVVLVKNDGADLLDCLMMYKEE